MSTSFNFGEVIKKGASEVALEELAKKGFKKVKVLDKKIINDLIQQAVDRVVEERLKEATGRERQQIQQDAKAEFGHLMKDRVKNEDRNSAIQEDRIEDLQQEAERLRAEIARKDDELADQRQGGGGLSKELLGDVVKEMLQGFMMEQQQQNSNSDLAALKDSIECLANKVATGVAAVQGGYDASATDERSIEALISRATSAAAASLDSNIKNVKVKKTQAEGVNKTLKKLRSMQSGGEE
ncbi:MAG: hypothetical protein V3T77_09300 [Planctomycetota bacterium]